MYTAAKPILIMIITTPNTVIVLDEASYINQCAALSKAYSAKTSLWMILRLVLKFEIPAREF